MDDKGFLSIGKFSEFSGISRANLIYYDKLGLFSPVARGENNYRYYSYQQYDLINLIKTMTELKVPLKTIRSLFQDRSPEKILRLFSRQSIYINREIEKLQQSVKLLRTLKCVIEGSLTIDESAPRVRYFKAEPVFIGSEVDYSNGKSPYEAAMEFCRYCGTRSLFAGFPVGGILSAENVLHSERRRPDRFFLKTPDGKDRKPAGFYLVGYGRGYYGQNDVLYSKLIKYAEENKLAICGPAYELYPLNEIALTNPDEYLIQISIRLAGDETG
jgi:DNA-binding transcriptional MerR regulator